MLGDGGGGQASGRIPGGTAGGRACHAGLPEGGGPLLGGSPLPPARCEHLRPIRPVVRLVRPPPRRFPISEKAFYVTDPLDPLLPPPTPRGTLRLSPSAANASRVAPPPTKRTRLNKGRGAPPPCPRGWAQEQRGREAQFKEGF